METMAIAIAIITGLTEVVKRAGVSTKYIPLVAVAFGIIYGLSVAGVNVEAVLSGIIAGLTSVGLFRTVQKTIAK